MLFRSVWISTAAGLTSITKDNENNSGFSFSGFDKYDGLMKNEFMERSVFISKANNIYWGGIDGFNILSDTKKEKKNNRQNTLIVGFSLFNSDIECGKNYDGNIILKETISQTKQITLNHNQNFFTIEFSGLNYINPPRTYYRYSLSGIDNEIREINSLSGNGKAIYTDIKPGKYVFRVTSADNNKLWQSDYNELIIIVKAPWWKTPIAYSSYIFLFVCIITLSISFYIRSRERKIYKEQIYNSALDLKELLQQINGNAHISEKEERLNMNSLLADIRHILVKQKSSISDDNNTSPDNILSPSDEKFINKALSYVETNIDNSDYSVEMLSRDMGMERTGLYRKLSAIIGKTPTSFIRNVRLQRAAKFLDEGLSVSETADRVGFATSSYLSKCFKEEYGIMPSEYIKQRKIIYKNT